MNIRTIEPTPSPNTMKVLLDEELPFGARHNYKKKDAAEAPALLQRILALDGVTGVYHVADFLAVERHPKANWEDVLTGVRAAFKSGQRESAAPKVDESGFGEVRIHVQMLNGIPLQVKAFTSQQEVRAGLPPRFRAAMDASRMLDDDNYLYLRKWVDFGARYGEPDEAAAAVAEELDAAYPGDRLDCLVQEARREGPKREAVHRPIDLEQFLEANWQERFRLLDEMPAPSARDLPVLEAALGDDKTAVRRLAAVLIGMVGDRTAIAPLERALRDASPIVRRTAGDCASDLGFVELEPAMIEALADRNKLVRWRAAMFLYEVGTRTAVPALEVVASGDPEYEVHLQAQLALDRLQAGGEAKGSVWKQMGEARAEQRGAQKEKN